MPERPVERLKARIYKDALQRTGRLPKGSEQRVMEKKAEEVAKKFEKKRAKR